jgi:hypothetical protein
LAPGDQNGFGAIQKMARDSLFVTVLAKYRKLYATSLMCVVTRQASYSSSYPIEILPISVRIHVYFNFANISFEESKVETSASRVLLYGTSVNEK